MFLNDLDSHFLKSLNYLYASDNIARGDPLPLQFYLEEAIKTKLGVSKDFSSIVAASVKHRRVNDFKTFISTVEESNGSSSDKELELDLFKEDLMCIVCNEMDVGARNRLLECSDCHMLYHQECHTPIVTNQDSFESWVCQNCKDANSKKVKVNSVSPVTTILHGKIPSSSSSKSSNSHRYKSDSKPEKYSKSSSKTAKPSTSSTSRSNVTPNINIISADKRIQIMKKKAAKLQEKRLTRVNR